MKKRRIRKSRLLQRLAAQAFASLGLVGCTIAPKPIPDYVAPNAGATARFVVRGTVPPGSRYGIYVLANDETCSGRTILGVGDAQRHPEATTLAASVVRTVEFRYTDPDRKVCIVRWTFTPSAGKTYLLRGTAQTASCSALVFDMTDPERMRPEPTALRRNPSGSACLPIGQSKSIASLGLDKQGDGSAVLRQGATSDDLQGLIGR